MPEGVLSGPLSNEEKTTLLIASMFLHDKWRWIVMHRPAAEEHKYLLATKCTSMSLLSLVHMSLPFQGQINIPISLCQTPVRPLSDPICV